MSWSFAGDFSEESSEHRPRKEYERDPGKEFDGCKSFIDLGISWGVDDIASAEKLLARTGNSYYRSLKRAEIERMKSWFPSKALTEAELERLFQMKSLLGGGFTPTDSDIDTMRGIFEVATALDGAKGVRTRDFVLLFSLEIALRTEYPNRDDMVFRISAVRQQFVDTTRRRIADPKPGAAPRTESARTRLMARTDEYTIAYYVAERMEAAYFKANYFRIAEAYDLLASIGLSSPEVGLVIAAQRTIKDRFLERSDFEAAENKAKAIQKAAKQHSAKVNPNDPINMNHRQYSQEDRVAIEGILQQGGFTVIESQQIMKSWQDFFDREDHPT